MTLLKENLQKHSISMHHEAEIKKSVLKILNYDGFWENKKIPVENQRFDWIKLIHGYQLVNIGWITDINLFTSMIWLV